ncbi:MAG: TonB-dependent receptor, partial [Acidobacteriaceae bacterium]
MQAITSPLIQRHLPVLYVVTTILFLGTAMQGQTAGDGAIQGTVTDPSGAVVSNANVSAVNAATSVVTQRSTNRDGLYVISPLIPGNYTVTVAAPGFREFRQTNLVVTAMNTATLNVALSVGASTQQVTVTSAPPVLDTTDATLGATISSSVYLDLPILANNQQRDITAVSNLLPGAQPGARSSLFSGTASRVEEVYLDGIPLTTISQIGDNRPILNLVPAEAIDQINVVTNGASAEYQGAGMVNYTTKSGGNGYHGTAADYVRNTIFDTWGFTAIANTTKQVVNGVITTVPAGKPIDHQNEFTVSVGGPISIPHLFNGRDKLFFFASYDKFHSRSAPNPGQVTIPTTAFRSGDFSGLLAANGGPGYAIYDPTSLASCTAHSTNGPCRYQFGYGPGAAPGPAGNPTATGASINVIPANEISPISQYMQKFLPDPTTSAISGNYLYGPPSGYDNWLYSARIDYDISPKQRLSGVVTGGNRQAYPFTAASAFNNSTIDLPLPYTGSDYSIVAGHWADIDDAYTFRPQIVNQFRFGWSNFGGPPLKNLTQGISQYEATTAGIGFSGVPPNGQAVTEFPTIQFNGSNAPNTWGFGSDGVTATTVSQTYTTLDNLMWLKGKHAMTFGFQMQRLEENASVYDGPTSALTISYNTPETASVVPSGSSYAYGGNTGYSYASFLLGAVNGTGITLQPFSVLGGRFHTYAPYFQDEWKVTSKLTLDLGVRWDYLPPYHEVLNRYSFLNPNLTNPVTGNKGALEFAGSSGGPGVACNCASPVSTYWKNWQPRFGVAYAINDKTVVSAGYATVYSHAGGTGGAGGTYNGTGQLGFTSSPNYPDNAAGANAGPAFYLNNSAYFASLGIDNANFGGPGYTVPPITAPGAMSQTLNVGNTVSSSTGKFVTASSAPGYADPYISGRAPQFNFWNLTVQHAFTNDITIMAAYAGTESHFLAGASNMRGLYAGQINPVYWALGPLLNSPATPANVAAAQAIMPSIQAPYASYEAAAALNGGQATIGQMLKWMPQFSGTSDTWGSSSANASYHALQISARKRMSHGLDLTVNYTYSKNLDDAGTQRSGFTIPAAYTLTGRVWPQNRIDRSISANSIPQDLNIYGVNSLPFGKSGWGSSHLMTRSILEGWNLSGLFTYSSGTPLLVTSSACNGSTHPDAGTCMPDMNPAFGAKTIRQNGSWGAGTTAKNFGTIHYLQGYVPSTSDGTGVASDGVTAAPCASSAGPFCNAQAFMFGDAARVLPYDGLRNPSAYNLSSSVFRAFDITERWKFILRADCQN